MLATLAGWRERLLQVAEKRLPALTRLKQPEALPVTLTRSRVLACSTTSVRGGAVLPTCQRESRGT